MNWFQRKRIYQIIYYGWINAKTSQKSQERLE